MNILELFAHIGLKADQGPADRFLGAVNGIKKDIIGAIAGTLSLAGAIKAVNAAMGDALELKKFSDATGASTDKMQQWRAVADQVSGSGAAVADSIKAIVSNQDKIKLGSGNISGYQLLGIDPRNDPYEVLKQIRDKTAKLEPGMRRNIIGMFGVSTDLISTLNLTNAQFDKMAARAYVISPSMIDGMNRARASMETVKNAVLYFTADLATKLGPGIEKVSGFLVRFVGTISNGVTMLDKFVRSTIGWKLVIQGIAAALIAMNAGFLLSPIGIFTAAMLVLFLLLQDFSVYESGKGRSLFGLIMRDMPGLGKILEGAFGFLGDLLRTIKEVMGGDYSGIDKLTEKWGAWGLVIDEIVGSMTVMRDLITGITSGDWSKLQKNPLWKIGEAENKLAGQAWRGIVGIANPSAKLAGGGITNQNFNFTITGISDPKQAAKEVQNMFQREMQKAQNQSVSGKKEK
jgi:hypothetical protein